jgi:transcription elongation factor GreB
MSSMDHKQEHKQVLISKEGAHRIYDEYNDLIENQRPTLLVQIQNAAAEGDRSENAEYQYGKIRLREMDKRIRFLQERIDQIKVKEPPKKNDRVAFLSWLTYLSISNQGIHASTIKIVGPDEIDQEQDQLSYLSPIAKALAGKYVGECASLTLPELHQILEVIAIHLDQPQTKPTWTDLIHQYMPSQTEWISYLSVFKVLSMDEQVIQILQITQDGQINQASCAHLETSIKDQIKAIAYDQALGKCFLGRKAGDVVSYILDDQQKQLEILEILDLP